MIIWGYDRDGAGFVLVSKGYYQYKNEVAGLVFSEAHHLAKKFELAVIQY